VFSPPPSIFSSSQAVTLLNSLNLPMFYTLDGTLPTTGSTPYTGPIAVSQNTTINAITAAYGYITSAVTSGTYSIQAPVPTISPASGTYYTTTPVQIADSVSGATIYYTTNGAAPTTSSTSCTNPCPLNISVTTTVKAIAAGGNYAPSNVAVATYSIAASIPAFSPNPDTYYAPTTVTITDTTPGVLIYYSTTGFPTTSSPSCSSPCTVLISTTSTLRAMAAGNGISPSGTKAGTYTIAASTPTFSPASGTYPSPLSVTISDTTSGVTIYYAINGFPTTSSPSCANPCTIPLTQNATIRAIAAGTGISQSGVGFATYTVH
jgi:hypothetical protein